MPRRGGLRPHGLLALVTKFLELRLDPAAYTLAAPLDAALAAAVAAFSDKDWSAYFPKLVEAAAAVGPSHR